MGFIASGHALLSAATDGAFESVTHIVRVSSKCLVCRLKSSLLLRLVRKVRATEVTLASAALTDSVWRKNMPALRLRMTAVYIARNP
jgi:hypothetical protein